MPLRNLDDLHFFIALVLWKGGANQDSLMKGNNSTRKQKKQQGHAETSSDGQLASQTSVVMGRCTYEAVIGLVALSTLEKTRRLALQNQERKQWTQLPARTAKKIWCLVFGITRPFWRGSLPTACLVFSISKRSISARCVGASILRRVANSPSQPK